MPGFTTAGPMRELALSKWGGLVASQQFAPNNLPPGASPQNWDCQFAIGSVGTRDGLSVAVLFNPTPGTIQYEKSCQLLGPTNLTLAQDSNGGLWQENLASPGTLTRFYSPLLNGARATSTTVNQREYIALSNLIGGSDQPRQYDATNLDRISQVGPGAGPSVPTVAAPDYAIAEISEIYVAQTIDTVVWGSYLNTTNAPPPSANLYFMGAGGSTSFTTNLDIGDLVYVSSVPTIDGQNPNGTYGVTSIGDFTDGNGIHQYFGVTAYVANSGFIRGSSGGTYQRTQALIQLTNPIPQQDAVVGESLVITGASVQGWNTTWQIAETPTEGQLTISATALTSNVATYTYSTASGEAPGWQPNYAYAMASQIVVVGSRVWQVTTPGTSGGSMPTFASSPQTGDGGVTWTEQASTITVLATVFNTANGNGIFNIQNQIITSATSTTFTVAITSPTNIGSALETGSAITGSGTALIIDPGTVTLGTGNPGTDPIYGDSTGGQIVVTNSQVAAGQRYAVCMFLTRNNYITPASPPVEFYTTGASAQLTFNNLPIGPPNVIARIVAITAANAGVGGPYFWIPDDVVLAGTAASLGQTTTIDQTIINDNVSTSLGPVTMNDAVLIASTNISEVGNNLQQQRELGECVKVVQWAGRCFYLGERTKVDQFVNLTFDGGSVSSLPAGWTISSGLTSYVSLITSQVFGQSLKINNTSGSTMNPTGTALASILCLSQTAYQQSGLLSAIIEPNTAYSIRVTAASTAPSGSLIVELYSPSLTTNWAVMVPLAGLTAGLSETIAALSNPLWQPVVTDLQLRVYAANMPTGNYVTVDRIEVFPSLEPFYTNQVAASYAGNTEAIDGLTGAVDTSILTSAALTNEYEFLDKFYLTTASKTLSPTQGSGEPGGDPPWTVTEISNAVGCVGPLAEDVGEEFVLVAANDGVYVFDGGNHMKISQEIQQLWDAIYQPSKSTIWIRNDLNQHRLFVGIPLPTPNQWLPNAPVNATPASPNVILTCFYLGLANGAQLGDGAAVVVSAFTGQLLFHDGRRKWTPWMISSAYADFITRADNSQQLWFGQAGTISKLDSTAQTDNGAAIKTRYVTFAFSDQMDNERLQIGLSRRLFGYALVNIEGTNGGNSAAGQWTLTLLPESVNTPYPYTQAPFVLESPALGDQNAPLNLPANRAFVQIDSDAVAGTSWTMRRIDLACSPDPRILVTGM